MHRLDDLGTTAFRRLLTGRVAIEGNDRPVDPHRFEHLVLVLGESRAHGGDGVGETGLVHGDRVEIALHDHCRALLADRRTGRIEPVQRRALVEEGGLRRI